MFVQTGVDENWIVDPDEEFVEQWILEDRLVSLKKESKSDEF